MDTVVTHYSSSSHGKGDNFNKPMYIVVNQTSIALYMVKNASLIKETRGIQACTTAAVAKRQNKLVILVCNKRVGQI